MTEISNLLTWFSNNAPVCWPLTLPRSESFAWLGKAMKDQKGQESTKDNWSWDRLYCWITISRYPQQFWSCLIIMDIFGHFSSGVFQMKKPSNGRFHQQRQILRRTAEIRLQNLRGKKKAHQDDPGIQNYKKSTSKNNANQRTTKVRCSRFLSDPLRYLTNGGSQAPEDAEPGGSPCFAMLQANTSPCVCLMYDMKYIEIRYWFSMDKNVYIYMIIYVCTLSIYIYVYVMYTCVSWHVVTKIDQLERTHVVSHKSQPQLTNATTGQEIATNKQQFKVNEPGRHFQSQLERPQRSWKRHGTTRRLASPRCSQGRKMWGFDSWQKGCDVVKKC